MPEGRATKRTTRDLVPGTEAPAASKKATNPVPDENPSHYSAGADFRGWSSARGRGGGENGRGDTDQEYGHGIGQKRASASASPQAKKVRPTPSRKRPPARGA